MQGLVNECVRGCKMAGLVLCEGRVFIGLSRSLGAVTDPAKLQQKAKVMFLSRGAHWLKTGIVGRGEAWFFGISMANPGKSLQAQPSTPDDTYAPSDTTSSPLNSNGSLVNG